MVAGTPGHRTGISQSRNRWRSPLPSPAWRSKRRNTVTVLSFCVRSCWPRCQGVSARAGAAWRSRKVGYWPTSRPCAYTL